MSDKTTIEWTDATWNPLVGCSRVSAGCMNCYAERHAYRFARQPGTVYEGTARLVNGKPTFTGRVNLNERVLDLPLRWKRPRRIFVNSMSDLFHESVSDETIDRIFAVMALAPQHTFQVLTKRPERMRGYIIKRAHMSPENAALYHAFRGIAGDYVPTFPFPNVWLGVSVEDQAAAAERIPLLLQTPAVVRFLSCEPLLGRVDLIRARAVAPEDRPMLAPGSPLCDDPMCYRSGPHYPREFACRWGKAPIGAPGIDWVIAGGESGPRARPMHPDWARSLRDQCAAAGVPFFFKQWGEWLGGEFDAAKDKMVCQPTTDRPDVGPIFWRNPGAPQVHLFGPRDHYWAHAAARLGKRAAGRLLDGIEHNGMPA